MKINTANMRFQNRIKRVIDTENLDIKNNTVYKNDVCELVIHSSQLIPMETIPSTNLQQDFVYSTMRK